MKKIAENRYAAEGAEVYAARMDEDEYNSAEEYAQEAVEATTSEASPVDHIRAAIENEPARSAWSRGVKGYADGLAEELEEAIQGGYFDPANLTDRAALKAQMLNGAKDWSQYSWSGSALIYDGDIAERLCSPSELKKTNGGERRPNSREEWLDVQARALQQAANMIMRLARA